MTREFPITNAKATTRAKGAILLFRLRRSLVISASALVIHFLVFLIRLYRWTISPVLGFLFGPSGGCRFTPSCSQYAMDAIRSRGALVGGWVAIKRICRCHPWGDCGHDPAPEPEGRSQKSGVGI